LFIYSYHNRNYKIVDTCTSNTKDTQTMRSKGGSAPSTRPAQATKATAATKMGATNSKSATAMKKAVTVKKTDMQAMKKLAQQK
jgi:hypothetical protein